MNINYDVVVVGAGNAGLVAALKASKEGKKVLLIDNNNIPGGIATSTLKGRFEFENSLHKLTGIMTDDNKGVIRKIFDEFEISDKIEWIKLTEGYKIIKLDNIKKVLFLTILISMIHLILNIFLLKIKSRILTTFIDLFLLISEVQ